MNKFLLLTTMLTMVSSTMFSQDDLYFTPHKPTAEEIAREAKMKEMREAYIREHVIDNTFYIGTNRNADEYNRRTSASKVQGTNASDSVASDVIDFQAGNGEYPDSIMIAHYSDSLAMLEGKKRNKNYDYEYSNDDFTYSRLLHGFYDYWGPYWGPWRHSFYDPWYYSYYDPFYDPWYYGYGYYGYAGWYDPWYYGWNSPYYHGWGWGPGFISIGGGGSIAHRPQVENGPRTVYGTANHSGSYNVASGGTNTAGTRVTNRGTRSVASGISTQDRKNNRISQTLQSIYTRSGSGSTNETNSSNRNSSRSNQSSQSVYRNTNTNNSTPTRTNNYTPSSSSFSGGGGGYSGGGSSGGSSHGGGSRSGGGSHGGGRR